MCQAKQVTNGIQLLIKQYRFMVYKLELTETDDAKRTLTDFKTFLVAKAIVGRSDETSHVGPLSF